MSSGTYYIMDNRVNVRESPDTSSKIITQLNIGDLIEVMKCNSSPSIIGEIEGYWCRIKYSNIVGYVFNYYIANKTLVLDIDENGINDYVFQRFSSEYYHTYYFEPEKDIILYINGEKKLLPKFIESNQEAYFSCDFYYDPLVSKNAFLIVLSRGFSPEELESYQQDIYLYTENNTIKKFRSIEKRQYDRPVKIEIDYPSKKHSDYFSITTTISEENEDKAEESLLIEYFGIYWVNGYYIDKPSNAP